jgi:hypothetical protein
VTRRGIDRSVVEALGELEPLGLRRHPLHALLLLGVALQGGGGLGRGDGEVAGGEQLVADVFQDGAVGDAEVGDGLAGGDGVADGGETVFAV